MPKDDRDLGERLDRIATAAAKARQEAPIETFRQEIAMPSQPGELVEHKVPLAFIEAILHGDDEHRMWLLEAAACWNSGQPVPAPRMVSTNRAVETTDDGPSPQVAEQLVERQAWFERNADRRRAGAFINTDPEYFASECADAIANGTLSALRSSPTVRNRDEVLEEAAKKLEREWPGPAANIVRALKDTRGLGLT